MTAEREITFYRRMVLIREFEELAYALFREGKLYGTTHSCVGQEAIPVGVISHLDRARDVITSNHRGHGHFLEFTDDVEGLLAELMGRDSGVCRGWGGSQHLHSEGFYSNGVLGSMVPVGVGMALAEKAKGRGAIVCNFLGDGALGEGVVYEAMNMAGLWRLPVLFCVESNGYQQATSTDKAVAGSLVERGAAFGLETVEIDGNDVVSIADEMARVIQAVRANIPHWVVFHTYRLAGHSKSDDNCYRDRAEEESWRQRDPIAVLGRTLSEDERASCLAAAGERLREARERAEAAPQAGLDPEFET